MLTDMDNNRANQCNPNHLKSGSGRSSGYHGDGSKHDLDNHANQLNPNNRRYQGGNESSGGFVYTYAETQQNDQGNNQSWCQIL